MNLSSLQTYCLDAMGITRYRLNNAAKPYVVFYVACENEALEQANKILLNNILNALQWPMAQVKVCAVSSGFIDRATLDGYTNTRTLVCALFFGVELEELPGNHLFQRLPGLSELQKDLALKKKVWNQLKSFVRKD